MAMEDEQSDLTHSETGENPEMEDGHIVISARKARSAGLGIANKRDGFRLLGAAAFALLALIVTAVVTSVTA
jgi:hypothetical protein